MALDVFAIAVYAPLFWRGLEAVLILGSTSPRRAELLSQIGLKFDLAEPDVDETILYGELATDYVTRMSDVKFTSVHSSLSLNQPDEKKPIILAADTVVVLDTDILLKPETMAQGEQMLRRLSGREHRVLSSVTVGRDVYDKQQFIVETIVEFRRLTSNEINSYWLTGEPKDKAGGYGVQGVGAIFVQSLKGSYSNVVGLPLTETSKVLSDYGIHALSASSL